MKTNESGESFDASCYQLPQQDWTCGHHCEGRPCAIGPNGNGECLVAQICTPVRDESGWKCTRARAWGGRCKEGPVPDAEHPDQKATCPHQPAPCQPHRTLRSKRRLLTGATAALALGCGLIILGGSSGDGTDSFVNTTAIVSPGELSTHHATLKQHCDACHSAASSSPLELLSCVFAANGNYEDSQKCLKCHGDFGRHAMYPHSVDPERMQEMTIRTAADSSGLTTQQTLSRALSAHAPAESGELACAACHVEHHGASFNLAALSNSQCQTCHASGFHSFADGHPDFTPQKRAFLYFDHFTHLKTHFRQLNPAGDRPVQNLTCSDCHVQDATGSSMLLNSFDNMCAQCHTRQIADDDMPARLRMDGTVFFTATSGRSATLPPFMEVLLLAKTSGTTQHKAPSEPSALSAPRMLLRDLAAERQEAVVRRLQMEGGVDSEQAHTLANRLDESGFFVALQHLEKLMLSDHSESPPDAEPEPPAGPWTVDRRNLTVTYRSRGHADRLLRDLISFAAAASTQYPDAPAAGPVGAFDRLFQQLAAPEAAGQCMKCHTLDAFSDGRRRINWSSRQIPSAADGFTKFAHAPHLTLSGGSGQHSTPGGHADAQCETCHSLQQQPPASRRMEFLLEDWMPSPDFNHPATVGLNPVHRKSCVKCHTSELAGDSCLQCHNYHIHSTKLDER